MDTIRVLRVIEYVGPRNLVESQVAKAIHGEKVCGPGGKMTIRAATIGAYPEILDQVIEKEPAPGCLLGEKCTCEDQWMRGCKQFVQTDVEVDVFGINGLVCSVCKEPQFETPAGANCKNGHGGAEGVLAFRCTVNHANYVGKCPYCHTKLP